MSETQKFAKIDKIAEGVHDINSGETKKIIVKDGLIHGTDVDHHIFKKNPQMKKWKETLGALSKKEKEEYIQEKRARPPTPEEQKNVDERTKKIQQLYEKEIRPNTSLVHFWLGEKIVKEKKLAQDKEFIEEGHLGLKDEKFQLESFKVQNIGVPETVDIDYSEIKDILVPKYGVELRPYKDGFLIVRDENPKSYHSIDLSDYTDNPQTRATMFFQTLVFNQGIHYYFRHHDIEKIKKHINNISLYIVFKRAYKNKAFKITFKNNKYLTCIFKLALKEPAKKEDHIKDVVPNLPAPIITNFVDALGIAERYEMLLDTEKSTEKEATENFKKSFVNFSKEQLLKAGYSFSILSKFVALITKLASVLKNNPKIGFKDTLLYNYKDVDPTNFKLLTEKVVEDINKSDVTPKNMVSFSEKCICSGRSVKKQNRTDDTEIMHNFIDLIVSYLHTEKGTSLPITGKINVEKATDIDCFHYWNYISLFNLVNGCLDKKDFPLLLEEGKIFNEQEIHKHIHELKKTISASPFRNPNESFNLDPETKAQVSEILTEAMEQTTGLLIPYNACVEIKGDPVFKYIRFIEYEKYIAIFAHDENDRFISEMYVKGEKEFRYWLYNSGQVFDSKVADSSKHLYLKLASCIRDWKVLIERDSTMQYRGPRVPTGVKSSRPRQVWLPITSYKRSTDTTQKSREKIFFSESRKFSGDRRAHRRKLQSGMKASKLQMLLAEDANIYVGDGYTFVRRTEWGKIKKSKRELKFRSKSMNTLLYKSDYEVKKAKEIKDLSPAGFEEKMEDFVAKDKWKVRTKKNYEDPGSGDGGIDIRAIKKFKDGSIKELIGQCKHPIISKKPIGPDILRELVGAAADVESKHEKVLMCMTSTWFTQRAMEYAERHNITLVTGGDLLK